MNAKDLLKFMSTFKYGHLMGKKLEQDDFSKYRMPTIGKTLASKIGVCHDQSLLEYDILTKSNYDCSLIFVKQINGNTHTFLIFKKNNKFYYFENSFEKYRGVHGPYNSVEEIVQKVKKQMQNENPQGKGFKWNFVNPNNLKPNMNMGEVIDALGKKNGTQRTSKKING